MAKSKSQDVSNTRLFANLWQRDFQSVRLTLHSMLMRVEQTSTSTASIEFQIDQVRRALAVLQEKEEPATQRRSDYAPEDMLSLDELLEFSK